jgi:hypothetical protein
MNKNRVISEVIGGAIGGTLGTAVMRQQVRVSRALPDRLKPPVLKEDPGEFLVRKFEEKRGHPLEQMLHGRAVNGLGWAYGTAWGMLLGALAPAIGLHTPVRAIVAGAGLGTLVWAAGYVGWLPATGLAEPVHRHRPERIFTSLISHVFCGIIAALPIYAIDALLLKRQRRFRF